MATWAKFIRTEKGKELDIKVKTGQSALHITKAMSGAGRVDPAKLSAQAALTNPKQTLIMQDYVREDNETIRLPIALSNNELTEGYKMHQLGIFANDPDLGEILYTISQTEEPEGEPIQSQTENSVTLQWDHKIKLSNDPNIQIVVSAAGMLTKDVADGRYMRLHIIPYGEDVPVEDRESGVIYREFTNLSKSLLQARIRVSPNMTLLLKEGDFIPINKKK